jgi:hypothetical protein
MRHLGMFKPSKPKIKAMQDTGSRLHHGDNSARILTFKLLQLSYSSFLGSIQ